MTIVLLTPVFLSAVLLGAHFFRAGSLPAAALALLFPAVLFIRRSWAARMVQLVLVLGAMEWAVTLVRLVAERREDGEPWTRLAVILGAVVVFTGASALVFSFSGSLRSRYGLGAGSKQESSK